uniref:Nucleolar protein 10 n=1 Tax=Timema cristinae TaxID=61476 RepID=A0A7R9DMV9_TIMCR|nr:unnamed protein product [Timema cristinae]
MSESSILPLKIQSISVPSTIAGNYSVGNTVWYKAIDKECTKRRERWILMDNLQNLRIQEHIKSVKDNEVCSLLNLGTCGLHVVTGSLRTGVESVDWDITRFSPEDKYSRQRITIKKRFNLLLTQQPAPVY